jgi:transposase
MACQPLKLSDNIKLMHLAPYSPELNPVELLWRKIGRKYFHNKIHNTGQFRKHIKFSTGSLSQHPDAIKKLSAGFLPI